MPEIDPEAYVDVFSWNPVLHLVFSGKYKDYLDANNTE